GDEGDAMRMGLPEIMSRSLDTMQAQISRVQLALDPPELLIRIPRDVCSFYEFWRAAELIDVGRAVAIRALDAAGYGGLRAAEQPLRWRPWSLWPSSCATART